MTDVCVGAGGRVREGGEGRIGKDIEGGIKEKKGKGRERKFKGNRGREGKER